MGDQASVKVSARQREDRAVSWGMGAQDESVLGKDDEFE